MTDKTDLIREIHEYVTAHGGENTATHLLVQAASAIQAQAAELEAVGAGGVQALSAAPAVPVGWKLVPVEPTADQEWAGKNAALRCSTMGEACKIYKAMLAASPTPSAEQQAITPETGNSASAQGAAITSEFGTPPAEQQAAPKAAPVKACVCGEPQASGTVHRVDGPCYVAAPQQEAQEPTTIDQKTMELAESVGLIGPASRIGDLHAAIQRFHDLICVNATIKAGCMAADILAAASKTGAIGVVESAVAGAGGFHVRLAPGAQMPVVGVKLYTAPQPVVREPLTREQALEIVNKKTDVMMAIRLTEAAHGITGGQHGTDT